MGIPQLECLAVDSRDTCSWLTPPHPSPPCWNASHLVRGSPAPGWLYQAGMLLNREGNWLGKSVTLCNLFKAFLLPSEATHTHTHTSCVRMLKSLITNWWNVMKSNRFLFFHWTLHSKLAAWANTSIKASGSDAVFFKFVIIGLDQCIHLLFTTHTHVLRLLFTARTNGTPKHLRLKRTAFKLLEVLCKQLPKC